MTKTRILLRIPFSKMLIHLVKAVKECPFSMINGRYKDVSEYSVLINLLRGSVHLKSVFLLLIACIQSRTSQGRCFPSHCRTWTGMLSKFGQHLDTSGKKE